MSDKIEVKRVEIDIAGKKLVLTPLQAKELRDILEETFPSGSKIPYYIPPVIIENEKWVGPYAPYPTYPTPWVTWWGGYTSDGTVLLSSNS